jgi:hypothetical protein
MQYEVYDASKSKGTQPSATDAAGKALAGQPKPQHGGVRVLSSIEFLQNGVKVYETKPLVASEVSAPERKAVTFQIDIPLESLKPGFYTCQVNVIDDVAATFAFPRWPILIKSAAPAGTPRAPATGE